MGIGIEQLSAHLGPALVDVRELWVARGLELGRFGNLMMRHRSVNLPCEDPVTNAVNAAKPIVDGLLPVDRERIELLIVATESGLDLGKPISTYVHHYLDLPGSCRSFEVKHACYGGTAALQCAAAIVATSQDRSARALVIATDAPSSAARGKSWEPSEGAGAVAMLVGQEGHVLQLDPGGSGYHTFEVMDTARPRPDLDLVQADVSLLAYLSCLEQSFGHYRSRVADVDLLETFDYLVFHTPFPGMVRGAHRMLMRKCTEASAAAIDLDFERRVLPSLRHCMETGNLFSAALYLALSSLLDTVQPAEPCRVGLFSYGSGCGSEFFSGITGHAGRPQAGRSIPAALAGRYVLSVAEHDLITDLIDQRGFGIKDAVFDPEAYSAAYADQLAGRGLLVLDRIENFHRVYRWS